MSFSVQDEALLDRFRQWLHEARAGDNTPAPSAVDDQDVGLFRLVEEFTALRHEVKLQTKSARGLQEQAESLLPALRQAIEAFQAVEPREAQAAWSAGKPLAEALADLDEALDRGRAELEKARRRVADDGAGALEAALNDAFGRRSWFGRRRVRAYHEQVIEVVQRLGPGAHGPLFDALREGYGLIQARLRRAMSAEQLQRIDTVGRPVDSALMTVVEVVDDPDQPAGYVVEEFRRGYVWRGRMLRYAEVSASRGAPAQNHEINGESS
ncbi:MAG: nucleotide exchange factor GrpE [Isosphaeraceae bacterium]|nr:nucleotide exchange factor GrpE [Isosphaeraceae bacterium]